MSLICLDCFDAHFVEKLLIQSCSYKLKVSYIPLSCFYFFIFLFHVFMIQMQPTYCKFGGTELDTNGVLEQTCQ